MERCRLTILVESRIRWKVYVRFGGEYWETYHRNMTGRRVLSLHNQIVKAVNAHFSNVTIIRQIAALEQRTRELKAISIEILNLAKCAAEWLRI
ncbi:plasmid mobilization protein [Alistipes senegalensis]